MYETKLQGMRRYYRCQSAPKSQVQIENLFAKLNGNPARQQPGKNRRTPDQEKMTEPEPKKKSEKRKRGKIIPVRVLPEEEERIKDLASQCSMSPSTYLRTAGLNKTIKSTLDSQVIIELAKLRSEVGRLGGLIKAWLSPKEKIIGSTPEGKAYLSDNKPALKVLLRDMDLIAAEIENKVKEI